MIILKFKSTHVQCEVRGIIISPRFLILRMQLLSYMTCHEIFFQKLCAEMVRSDGMVTT